MIYGYSDNKTAENDIEGYWIYIRVEKQYIENFDRYYLYGWVFSDSLDINPEIETSTITFVDSFYDKEWKKYSYINIEFDRMGNKQIEKVYLEKFEDQENYCFVWAEDVNGFLFNDPFGTFRWNPKTKEITHLTNIGSECESAFCIVSDDGKYLFQDFGTSPGIRGLAVYDLTTEEEIFGGSYKRPLDFDGKSISVVKSRYSKDPEALAKIEEFRNTYDNSEKGYNAFAAKYRFNLETKELTFVECFGYYEQ